MAKKYFVFILLFTVCFILKSDAIADTGEIYKHVFKDYSSQQYKVYKTISLDLNDDNLNDYIVVLVHINEDNLSDQKRLLIIYTTENKILKKVGESSEIVFCRTCGGMLGDPFQGIRYVGNLIYVTNYGGSRWRWSNEYRLKYDEGKIWLVEKELCSMDAYKDTNDCKTTKYNKTNRIELKDIKI